MEDKWYFKEIHLDRDPPLPPQWVRAGITSCRRDVAVKYCPRWHNKGRENALTKEEVINRALTDEEIKVNGQPVENLIRSLYKTKSLVLQGVRKKKDS